jgi:magnesium-transporting ATPase (P-type)
MGSFSLVCVMGKRHDPTPGNWVEEKEPIMMHIFARSWHRSPLQAPSTGIDTHIAMIPLADLYDQFHTSERGLTHDEAHQRLLTVGPNEPVAHRRGYGMRHVLAFATNPLVVILLLASVVSGILHDITNAAIIGLVVCLSVVLNFVQTYRSQQAA